MKILRAQSLFEMVRHQAAVDVVTSPLKALGGVLGSSQPAAAPAPVTPPAVPTVDNAAVSAQQQEQSAATDAKKRGALSTFLNTDTTSTGDSLGSSTQETTLKRFLGS